MIRRYLKWILIAIGGLLAVCAAALFALMYLVSGIIEDMDKLVACDPSGIAQMQRATDRITPGLIQDAVRTVCPYGFPGGDRRSAAVVPNDRRFDGLDFEPYDGIQEYDPMGMAQHMLPDMFPGPATDGYEIAFAHDTESNTGVHVMRRMDGEGMVAVLVFDLM